MKRRFVSFKKIWVPMISMCLMLMQFVPMTVSAQEVTTYFSEKAMVESPMVYEHVKVGGIYENSFEVLW